MTRHLQNLILFSSFFIFAFYFNNTLAATNFNDPINKIFSSLGMPASTISNANTKTTGSLDLLLKQIYPSKQVSERVPLDIEKAKNEKLAALQKDQEGQDNLNQALGLSPSERLKDVNQGIKSQGQSGNCVVKNSNEACPPDQAEIERRKFEAEQKKAEINKNPEEKPSESKQSGTPPLPEVKPEGGGDKQASDEKKEEGPMEGFKDKKEKKMTYKCDKKGKNCKPDKQNFAQLEDTKSGGGQTAWMKEKQGIDNPNAGEQGVQKGNIKVGGGSIYTNKVKRDPSKPGTMQAAGEQIPEQLVQTGPVKSA